MRNITISCLYWYKAFCFQLHMMTKVVLYIICHDDASYKEALQLQHEMDSECVTSHIIKLGSSIFFENIAFRHIRDRANEWKDATFVGMMSYSIKSKVQYNLNIKHIVDDVAHDIDVISLYNIALFDPSTHKLFELSLYDYLLVCQGSNAMNAWYALLSAKGTPYTEIQRKIDNAFYCNSFLARPCAMADFIKFNIECQDIVMNNPDVRNVLLQKVPYSRQLRSVELAEMKKYGVDHWVCVPFVFERLAPWFFSDSKYKTIMIHRTIFTASNSVQQFLLH